MSIPKWNIITAIVVASLFPVSASLLTHLRVISNEGLVISLCLSLHHANNLVVSAEKILRKNDSMDSPATNVRSENTKKKNEGKKSKIPKSRPPPSDMEKDARVCLVDATTGANVPSVTALEYLGMGYNLIEGNPRGSDITELDPGFRSGVILLQQSTSSFSSDKKIAIPLGVELRYLTSCEFSSKATELSNVRDYQRRLSRESKVSAGGGIFGAFKGFSGSFDFSYSKSERFKSFQNDRSRTQNAEFESSAICTEFEGRLNSYYNHSTRDTFNIALSPLPSPFNNSTEHILAYKKFISEYGTHYVSKVVLGAKQIYTVVMKSNSVAKLREQQTDVATTIGAKAMFKFSKGGDEKSGSVSNSGDNNNLISIVNPPKNNEEGEGDSERRRRLAFAINANVEKSTSESDFKRRLEEIKKEVTEVREVNIGGVTPSEDGNWREWARSARERPMPVVYDLEPLWNLMDEEMKPAFKSAIDYIYDPENDDESDNERIQRALNIGVAAPNGEPISTYSFDKTSGLRSRVILREPSDYDPFYMYDIEWSGSNRAVSAVFASTIRDNIAPNTKEDEFELGFFDNRFSNQLSLKNSLNIFGLSQEPGTATIGVFEHIDVASENMLNSFTYFTADNVEEIDEFVVGVVHPQGYALNKEFAVNPGFYIEMENDREFRVIFTKAFTSPPTFIVSPMWFAANGVFPSNMAEIQIGLTSCSNLECKVQVGGVQLAGERASYFTKDSDIFTDALALILPVAAAVTAAVKTIIPNVFQPWTSDSISRTGINPFLDLKAIDNDFTDQYLGFSFMAIDPSYELSSDTNLKMIHGIITIDVGVDNIEGKNFTTSVTITEATGSGYKASARFKQGMPFSLSKGANGTVDTDSIDFNDAILVTNQTVGGVRIDFDDAFVGVPAVFASPITADFQFGRAEVSDVTTIASIKRFWGIKVSEDKKVITKNAELVGSPSVLVEHITERSTFIKAGIVHTVDATVMLNGGSTPSIYDPVSFHFVAIGPIKRNLVTDTL